MISQRGRGVATDDSGELLKAINLHVRQGENLEALVAIEELLERDSCTQELFDCAAKATISSILDGSLAKVWTPQRRDSLITKLLLQRERYGLPYALHHEIASRHSAGLPQVLTKVAYELRPVLSRLWDGGLRDHRVLLMILLLRSALVNWRDEDEISRWHVEALLSFDPADMAIPYNIAFDAVSFTRNVEDLRGLADRATIEELVSYGPWKIIYLHIITGSDRLERDCPKILEALNRASSGHEQDTDMAAGLRSFTLRALAASCAPAAGEKLAPGFSDFAREWTGLCSAARSGSDSVNQKSLARVLSRKWQAFYAAIGLVERRAPFLHLPGRRKPRIAVCISGQLRGFKQARRSWYEGLLRTAETQTFVHSWYKVGRSSAEPFRAYLPFEGKEFCAKYREQAHGMAMNEIMERYPRLFAALRETGNVTTGEIGAFYVTDNVVLEDDSSSAFAGWSNSAKMHYKISEASKLAAADNLDADLVLRIRPDKRLGFAGFSWGDLLTVTNGHPLILADFAMSHQYAKPMIGDQVAIGAPAAMAVYAATYRMAPHLAEQKVFACGQDFHGHVSLALTCWHGAISVQRLPVQMGELMEAEPLAARTVLECMAADSVGRKDKMDAVLLGAIRADVKTTLR